MSTFYVRACPQGHVHITYRRAGAEERCPECSLPLIDSCPQCGRIIKNGIITVWCILHQKTSSMSFRTNARTAAHGSPGPKPIRKKKVAKPL